MLAPEKLDLRHWGCDLASGTGKKVAKTGNGKDVLQSLSSTDHLEVP